MATNNSAVIIYTDGGCVPNPGIGGWGAILQYNDTVKELSGGARQTTNNRMELTAALEALKALKRPCKIELYTDSEYLRNGITTWLPAWKRRGWQRKSGPVKNQDLWQELDEQAQKHQIDWRWVRGHTGDLYNERCDQLAADMITRIRDKVAG